ncbi:MAG TPA: amidohydrolase family protein [Mycobacteriales bacterium]|nr:amidohydrolase family protein [Mycobacteriales bacterium]
MTRTVFTGGTVFDGTGSAPASADVVVEAGRIVEIGPGLDGDEAVDCAGATVLPGLFDCHVHVTMSTINPLANLTRPFSLQYYEAAENMRRTLAVGVTSVRDAGGADLGIQTAQARGLIPGPRMRIAIGMLSQTGGHADGWQVSGGEFRPTLPHPGRPSTLVDGPDEMRRKVRELIRAGADVIKVATSGGVLSPRDDPRHGHFRDAEIAVLVEEATAAGIFVMAHAQASDGIKVAVRNGVRSIEHGIYLDDEAIGMMLDRGAWLVPTLVAPRGVIAAADAGMPVPETAVAKARMVMEAHTDSVRRAVAAGVKVAMGTDSGVTPHGQNLRELPLMADCGMTPEQVLHATTLSAARLVGVDDGFGSIEPDKRADLVIVDGDARTLHDLDQRVRSVYQDGRLVSGRG